MFGKEEIVKQGFGEILAKVKELIPNTPIVLHGASTVIPELVEMCNKYGGDLPGAKGVPDEILHEASKSGVSKINVDTDLRLAMTAQIRKVFAEEPSAFPQAESPFGPISRERRHLPGPARQEPARPDGEDAREMRRQPGIRQ